MADTEDLVNAVQRLADERGRFPFQAYLFVFRALGKSQELAGKQRHVTGQELLEAARQVALELFGPLTLMVFGAWGLEPRFWDLGPGAWGLGCVA